jgi:hypothetical protein
MSIKSEELPLCPQHIVIELECDRLTHRIVLNMIEWRWKQQIMNPWRSPPSDLLNCRITYPKRAHAAQLEQLLARNHVKEVYNSCPPRESENGSLGIA